MNSMKGQIQGKATSHDSGQIETVAGNHRQHHSEPSPWHWWAWQAKDIGICKKCIKLQFTSGMCQGYFRMTVTWQSCESSAMAVTVQPQAFQILAGKALTDFCWTPEMPDCRTATHSPRWLRWLETAMTIMTCTLSMTKSKTPGGAHQRTELRCQEENFLTRWHFQQRHHKSSRGRPFISKSADLGKRVARMLLQNWRAFLSG